MTERVACSVVSDNAAADPEVKLFLEHVDGRIGESLLRHVSDFNYRAIFEFPRLTNRMGTVYKATTAVRAFTDFTLISQKH